MVAFYTTFLFSISLDHIYKRERTDTNTNECPLPLVWCRAICCVSLDNSGIVRTAGPAFVVQPMESASPFLLTVVTKYVLTPIPVFLRKLFSSQQCIKHAKVHRHISQGFAADRTSVVATSVCLKASWMHEVATREGPDCRTWCKQEVTADWTVRL